nr:MAG: polyprotein [Picornavirales sp.]
MVFVFSGEKKTVALLILVVVFGTTFGTSLTKNQLEVCHLLEGTQDDLATRNSSDAKAENWKEENVDGGFRRVVHDSVGTQDRLWLNLKLRKARSKDKINISFVERGSYARNLSANETPPINQSYVVDGERLPPSCKIAYQGWSFLKELDNACTKSRNFIFTSLVDFCIHVDNLMLGCPCGDCDVTIPALSFEEWSELFAFKLKIKQGKVEREPEFKLSVRDDPADTYLWLLCYDTLYRNLCEGLKGRVNPVSYDMILRFALFFFALIIVCLGYDYIFERPRRRYNMTVQGDCRSSEEVWEKIMQRVVPGKKIEFSKKRVNKFYRVIAVVTLNTGKIKYTCDSKESYQQAYLHLALRWPKKQSDFALQGILRTAGIRETCAIKFLKCTCFFVYAFWRSRTMTDKIVATTHWIDQLLDIGLAKGIDMRICDFYTLYRNLPVIKGNQTCTSFHKPSSTKLKVDVNFESSDDEEPSLTSDFGRGVDVQGVGEFASILNSFLKGVFNSSSIKACFRLVSLIWHLLFVFKDGKIDWDHLNKWDSAMFSNIPEKALNIGNTLLEQISNLATCSWEFYHTGDFNVFLRNDNEVSSFLEAVEKLTAEVKNVPIEPKLNASMMDLEARIHNMILRGENMRPKVKLSIRGSFTAGLLQLRSLALDVSTLARASSTRAAPYTLLITGAPKIGKSSITALIFKQFQMTNPYNSILKNGISLHDNGVYTRTLKEEYWSCYMNSYWGILYDDLGQTNPKVTDFALEINEIIQVVNNVMFFPQMAGVEEKGRRYVAPQIVLATSNNKDINAHHAVRSPGAVLRRFPFVVTPHLRPEFATDSAIDGAKAAGHMDLWTFTIEEVVLRDKGKSVTYREIHSNLSTSDFLQWVDSTSLDHYRGQANSDEYQKRVNASSLCSKCRVLSAFCKCPKAPEVSSSPVLDTQAPSPVLNSTQAPPQVKIDNDDSEPPPLVVDDDDHMSDDELDIHRDRRIGIGGEPVGDGVSDDEERHGGDSSSSFGSNCAPQYSAKWYTGSFVLLFACIQMGILGMFCSRIANQPVKWFWRLYIQKSITQTVGNNFAVGFCQDRNSASALFWRFMNNFYKFDAVDSGLLLWLNGWNATSSWIQQSAVKAQNAVYNNPKTIAAIACVLLSGMFIMWWSTSVGGWSFSPQGDNDIPAGVDPPPAVANIENSWKASQKLGFKAFLTSQSTSGDVAWFEGQMSTATAHLKFNKAAVPITAFNVFGNYWLLPKHFIKHRDFKSSTHVTVTRYCHTAGMGSYYGVFDHSSLREDPNSDFAIIRLNTPPGVNLIPYLSRASSGLIMKGKSLFMREEGPMSVAADPVKFGDSPFPEVSAMNGMDLEYKYRAGFYKSSFNSVNGDCGSPLYVCEAGTIAVLGFHVGNMTSNPVLKYVMSVPIDFIKSVYESEESCVVQGNLDTEKLDGKVIEVTDDIHPKCPIRFTGLADMPSGNSAIPIGSFKGLPMNHFSTKVKENLFASFWKAKGYVSNKVRPVLSAVGVGSWMPKRNFLLNVCQHKDLIPHDILNKCADHFFESFVGRVSSKAIKDCVVINEETNLYGSDGNNFISHMKFDTGAGFPHNKPKYAVLDRVTHPKFPDGTCALPAGMRLKIERMEKTAAEGVRINVVFNSSLKDEPISMKKLEAGKIRVFQAICVEGLFLLRKYFLALIALFQTWNFASEAAIGMDCTGPDWDDLHDHIFVDKWKVFCGDYSNYDQRMSSSIMMAAWGILIRVAKLNGNYGKVALKIMWVLAVECCYSVVNFFGDLLCLNGSNPSGHGLTVVINSICNSIYIRVAWYDIFGNLDDFLEHVRIMTYGDDNIISVHPKYQDRFNQVTVTAALAKYGIVYTDALKTGNEAKPFCEPHEISFLKRSWVRSPHGFWLAPLEIASIHKMLIIGVDNGKVHEKDRLSSVLISSVMEAFQHGEEFFETHLVLARECADQYELAEWVAEKGGFPTFQSLLDRRLAKVSRLSLLRAAH